MRSQSLRRGYISVGAGQLHYRYAGKPHSPLLLLIHQAPSSSVMYQAMMAELASDYYVLAPDLPGFGQSDALPGGNSIADWADSIAAFCRAFSQRVAGVFGHHTGAAVATELLYRHPYIDARLMLSGPTLLSPELQAALPDKARAFPLARDGGHMQGMWQRMLAKDGGADLALVLRESLLGLAMGESYPDAYQAVIDHDFRRAIRAVTEPVLMFAGSADPLYPVLDEAFSEVRRGVKSEIAGAASWVCDRQPGAVCALIRRFMTADVAANSKREWRDEP
ncbi:alpha/beta fold hydrolase [Spongiibacter sp.]|uniref:alpha/beta fold hydrolase n=1 Tax=Spongiibacter sp. TaxID=2024860 RepID=UPI00356AA8DB